MPERPNQSTEPAEASLRRLQQSATTAEFIAACSSLISSSPHVSVNLNALSELKAVVSGAKPVRWDWFLRNPEGSVVDAGWDFLVTSALNGGYFQVDQTGAVSQWEVGGSGSAALVDWYRGLREAKLVPGVEYTGSKAEAASLYAPWVEGQPHAPERLAILCDFASRSAFAEFQSMMMSTGNDDGTYHFTLHHADWLASVFPRAFGQDPFRKKACLAFLLLSGHIASRGGAVIYDLPIPSDYQIPRILAWKGVILVSNLFEARLRDRSSLISVFSEEVMHYRAAAVVAAHRLGLMASVSDYLVDGALFGGFRKDPDLIANGLPPMKCDSLWF